MGNELDVLFPRVRASVLCLLWMGPERGYHLRDLARRSGLAIGTIQQEVRRLASVDLILSERDGNRLYYSANQKHPLFADIHAIILKTSGIVAALEAVLKPIKEIRLAWIFGSMARGDYSHDSDIDLFLIGSTNLLQLVPLLRPLMDTFERELNPVLLPENEYWERLHHGDTFLETILTSPKLWVIGSENGLERLAEERLAASPQNKLRTGFLPAGDS